MPTTGSAISYLADVGSLTGAPITNPLRYPIRATDLTYLGGTILGPLTANQSLNLELLRNNVVVETVAFAGPLIANTTLFATFAVVSYANGNLLDVRTVGASTDGSGVSFAMTAAIG